MKPILVIALAGLCALAPARSAEPTDPAQQEQQLNDAWSKLPLVEKRRLLHLQRALQQMQLEERKFIHDRIERFLTMTPAEREQLRKNRERWAKMTPEERDQARQEFRRRRKEFEAQWRRDHPNGEPPPPMRLHQPHGSPSASPPETSEPQTEPKQEKP